MMGYCQFLSELGAPLTACPFLIGNSLHAVQHANLFDAVFRTFLVMFQGTVKIPAAVCPAAQDHYPAKLVQQIIYRISVHLQGSLVVLEKLECGLLSTRALMVVEEYQGLGNRSDEPHIALDRPVPLIIDDRYRALVRLKVVKLQHVFLNPVIHRAHQVGYAEEPSLDGGLLQLYAQALEHLYLTVERKVVCKLADREFRQCRGSGIALGERLHRNRSREDLAVRLAHGLVADGDSHVGVRGGDLQMLRSLHLLEQDPLVLMADIAIRIDVFFHVAQVLRQFLADRRLLLMLPDSDLAGFDHLPGGFLYLTLLFVCESHTIKVELQLAGIFRSLALLAHPAPQFAGHIFKAGHKAADLILLL